MPPFLIKQNTSGNATRRLAKFNQLDVTRDLFEVEFDFYDDQAVDQIEYSVRIREWTEKFISLGFNFTKPLLVSHGPKQDKVIIRLRNDTLIRSKETGKPINTKNIPEFVILIPKQLPNGMPLETLASAVTTSGSSMMAVMIIQLIF